MEQQQQEQRLKQISRILWKNFHNRIDYENLAADIFLDEWRRSLTHSYSYIVFRGIDEVRRRNREIEYVPGVHESLRDPDLWTQDSWTSLLSTLQQKANLSLPERWILYEKFTLSLSNDEIAKQHSLHPSVVGRMLREIIEKLRIASLEKHYDPRNGSV